MRIIFFISLLIMKTCAFCQNKGDSKIIVALTDSNGIYNKVKFAFVKNNFIVKDDGVKDTLTTYPREIGSITGYCVAIAQIKNNIVLISGIYGLKKLNDWGYTTTPKNYNKIIFYRGSKTWRLLNHIAESIGGQISFAE